MQQKPTNWDSYFANPNHSTEYRIKIGAGNNPTVYGMDKLQSLTITEKALNLSEGVGRCYAASMQLSMLIPSTAVPKMAMIRAECRLNVNGSVTDWIPQGTFYVDTREKNSLWFSATCYDAMLMLETPWPTEGTQPNWPMPMSSMVSEICLLTGLTLDSRTVIHSGGGYTVPYPNELTLREILADIGAAHGGSWHITAAGKLRLLPLRNPSGAVDYGSRLVQYTSDDLQTISGVSVYHPETEESYSAGTESAYVLDVPSRSASAALALALINELNGVTFHPFTASGVVLDPATEPGDSVTVSGVTSLIGELVRSCTADFRAYIALGGAGDMEHEYPYLTGIERAAKRSVKTGVSYYGTSITRSNGLVIEKTAGDFPTYPGFYPGTRYPGYGSVNPEPHNRVVLNSDTLAFYNEGGTPVFFWDNQQHTFRLTALETEIDRATGAEATLSSRVDITAQQIQTEVTRASAAEGTLSSRITQTAESITAEVTRATGAEGTLSSRITQTAESITAEVTRATGAEGTLSSRITQTAESITAEVTRATGAETRIEQTADKISWIVSGSSSSSFTLTSRMATLVAAEIDLTGYVTIRSLQSGGTTTVDGGRITTGTISAERIDVGNLKVKDVYDPNGTHKLLSSYSGTTSNLFLGGDMTGYSVDKSYLFGGDEVIVGTFYNYLSTNSVHFDFDNDALWSAGSWGIGTLLHPFDNAYIEKIYIGTGNSIAKYLKLDGNTGEKVIVPGTDGEWALGSSLLNFKESFIKSMTAEKVEITGALNGHGLTIDGYSSNRSILPDTNKEWTIGSSSYMLKESHIQSMYADNVTFGISGVYGAGEIKLGTSANSKLGFFGATVNTRQALNLSTTNMGYTSVTANNYLTVLNNLCGILINKYGMIG